MRWRRVGSKRSTPNAFANSHGQAGAAMKVSSSSVSNLPSKNRPNPAFTIDRVTLERLSPLHRTAAEIAIALSDGSSNRGPEGRDQNGVPKHYRPIMDAG